MNLMTKRIAIFAAIITGMGTGLACSASNPTVSIPENPANLSIENQTKDNAIASNNFKPEVPRFEAEIGHYEASQSFTDFIFEHQN